MIEIKIQADNFEQLQQKLMAFMPKPDVTDSAVDLQSVGKLDPKEILNQSHIDYLKVSEESESVEDEAGPEIEIQHVNGLDKKQKKKKTSKKVAERPEPAAVMHTIPNIEVDREAVKAKVSKEIKSQMATKSEVAEALQKVCAEKNIAVAKAILIEFNCQKLSDLSEADYPKFISACKRAIAG